MSDLAVANLPISAFWGFFLGGGGHFLWKTQLLHDFVVFYSQIVNNGFTMQEVNCLEFDMFADPPEAF